MKIKTETFKSKTMKNQFLKFAAAAIFATVLISCDDDDTPEVINEEELITTVEYTLTSTTAPTVTFTFVDQDGDGPLLPTVTNGTLAANTTYTGSVRFLNELETPVENITEEVAEEADEHEVFYNTTASGVTITKVDNDPNGNPLGLITDVTTGAATTGTLTLVLRHEPKKPNNGTLSDAGGETDVQVIFNVTVQ